MCSEGTYQPASVGFRLVPGDKIHKQESKTDASRSSLWLRIQHP